MGSDEERQEQLPRVYMCQPGYGAPRSASSKQFWACPLRKGSPWRGRLTQVMMGGSLLANNFNQFWVHALNLQEQGVPIQYFVMLHDDIVPDDGWLDTLIEDIESSSADLVSALVPIKDPLGLSSTAIDDPKDQFNVERRITMWESFSLPPVFDHKDCGYPDQVILANTGCWICRFDRDWRKAYLKGQKTYLRFTIDDRIMYYPDRPPGRRWAAEVAPEDWNFSREIQKLGAKVMITRRVSLSHEGTIPFSNRDPWGEWKFDHVFGYKFGNEAIKGSHTDQKLEEAVADEQLRIKEEGEATYHSEAMGDIEGWLSDAEGQALSIIAEGKQVLEIGTHFGRSTVWMAKTANFVHTIDPFLDYNGFRGDYIKKSLMENLVRHRVHNKVMVHEGTSEAILKDWGTKFDLIFIDGDHSYVGVKRDIALTRNLVPPGGLIAFHDYGRPSDPGVSQAVNEFVEEGAKVLKVIGTLALVMTPEVSRVKQEPVTETLNQEISCGQA